MSNLFKTFTILSKLIQLMQKMIKSIGGNWNPAKKLLELPYKSLGLEHRIIYDKKWF